jgi:hypothetical protein
VQAQLLDQPVDPPGADAVDVGLLHDGDQGLLGPPARLQEAGEVGALAQPGDRQLQLAHARVPPAGPVAVAVGEALGGALAELGADLRGDLGFHQLGGHPRRAVAQHVGVLVNQQLVGELGGGHPGRVGHRGSPFVALREQIDDSQTPRWPNSQSTVQPAGAVTPLSPTRPSARADERTRPPTLPARLRLWSESRTDNATLLGSRDSSQAHGVRGDAGRKISQVVALAAEEVLYAAWRDHGNESARLARQVGNRVRHLPGEPQEPARRQCTSLLANLVVELSLKHDDDLILRLVNVQWGATRVDYALQNGD